MPKADTTSAATGLVIAHHGVRVKIERDSGEVIEFKPPRRTAWVVGEKVIFKGDRPTESLPRTNALCRISSSGKEQTLAANLDLLLIVTACGEAFKPGLLDRFIVAARYAGITPALTLNKIDLDNEQSYAPLLAEYGDAQIATFAVSALAEEGLQQLADALEEKTVALVGQSGVGKSSLVNRLVPGANLAVGEINAKTEQGRHTTTASRMVVAANGARIVDSPGIRQFIPSGLSPLNVAAYFPGFELACEQGCRFADCLHQSEPGCAALAAKEAGNISSARYESYLRLLASVEEHDLPHWHKPHRQ